jgi:hypothetical protein
VQVKALSQAGCKRIFEEEASGGRWDRPELHKALEQLREGDVLVVWKLDRLSRFLKDLLHIMERVREVGAGFRSLTEAVDTTTAAGRMMMQMLGSFAEFGRRPRSRRQGGALAKLSLHQQQEIIRSVRDGSKTAADAAIRAASLQYHPLAGARRTDLPKKTSLLAHKLKCIRCRLGWLCMKWFPERWIIVLRFFGQSVHDRRHSQSLG